MAAYAWYGAINHVVLRWLLNGEPARLEETYPALRALLLYGVTGAAGSAAVMTAASSSHPVDRVGHIDDAVAHARHSGKRHSILESSGSRSHRMQSPFCPPAPRRSAPGHSGSNPVQGSRSRARVGLGDACDRIRSIRPNIYGDARLRSRLVRDDAAVFPCLGGFAFSELGDGSHLWSDFPSARLVVPQVLIQNDGDGAAEGHGSGRAEIGAGRCRAADRRSVPTRTRLDPIPAFCHCTPDRCPR